MKMSRYTEEDNARRDRRAEGAGRTAAMLGLAAAKGVAGLVGRGNDLLAKAYDKDYDPDDLRDEDMSNPWARNSMSGIGRISRKVEHMGSVPTVRQIVTDALMRRADERGDGFDAWESVEETDIQGSGHREDCTDIDDYEDYEDYDIDDFDDPSSAKSYLKKLGRAFLDSI